MTNRKVHKVFYRLWVLVFVAVAALVGLALFFAPQKAHADEGEVEVHAEAQPTHDQVFGANHANSRPFSLSDEEILYVEPGKYSWPDKYFLKASTFHLTEDVVISNSLQMIASYFGEDTYITVNICLHGHSLTYKSFYAIDMAGDCTLNIYDCGGDDNHSGSICGLSVINGAEANLYSGALKGYRDSGVSVYGKSSEKNATFNMYGGEISGNGTQGTLSGGGGVSIGANGVFNMYGGIISNNTVKKLDGGGVRVGMESSTFHMYGGTITNNTLTFNEDTDDEVVTWYDGAGVYNLGGTFTMQGNVNISGNVKGKPSSLSANNVYLSSDAKIQITGALGAGSQIGVTAEPGRVVTSGYSDYNTQSPSTYFTCDNSDYSIGYDEDLGKEAAVFEGEVVEGNFTLQSATATSYVGTPKVGDTKITLNIEAHLENEDGQPKTIYDVKTVECSPLTVGSNTVSSTYTYRGVTKPVSYTFTLDKVSAAVSWSCTGATASTASSATVVLGGSNMIGNITATYMNYNGQAVTVNGSSSDMIVKNSTGTVVNSITTAGTYTVSLAASEIYEFSNNLFTLTVDENPGYYRVENVTASNPTTTYTVGDTTITVTVTKSFKHTKTGATKTETETKSVTLENPLTVGANNVSFKYTYVDEQEGTKTVTLTVTVTAGKKTASVAWYFNGAIASGNVGERDYDGGDALELVSAKYTGSDGALKTVLGTSDEIVVKNAQGTVVTSATEVGEYTITLADSADYVFTNNSFTLTVKPVSVDEGYYKVQTVTASLAADATPTAGDTTVNVAVIKSLKHTVTEHEKTETVGVRVNLTAALQGGSNNVAFDYKYNDPVDGEKTVRLSLTVNAAKKQVSIVWYYNDVASGNSAQRVFDGTDASGKIVATYTGLDGTTQRVTGAAMIKKDANGGTVSSISAVGVYTLSLGASTDYEFKNNSFTFTVTQKLSDISDLFYEENDEVIIGVTSEDGFANGTEMVVERVENGDWEAEVGGKVSTAFNVSFVKNSVEVAGGPVTVQVLIPDELRSGKPYKIYNYNSSTGYKEIKYTLDGDYAVFTSDELSTILFVTEETPIIGPTQQGGVQIDAKVFMWLWVFLAILAICSIVSTVVLIVSKRNKK